MDCTELTASLPHSVTQLNPGKPKPSSPNQAQLNLGKSQDLISISQQFKAASLTDLVLTQQIKPGHENFYKPKIGRREFSERQDFSVRQEFSIRHKFRGRPKFMVRPKFCVRRTENEKLRVRPKFMVRQKFCGRRKVSGRRKFSTNG